MRTLILFAALATASLSLTAQPPQVQNGQITNAASSNLSAELNRLKERDETAWLVYTVPTSRPVQSGWGSDQVDTWRADTTGAGTARTTKQVRRSTVPLSC